MFIIKFFIYFALSFTILSLPIGNKNLFHYIDHLAAPYTKIIFKKIRYEFNDITGPGKDLKDKIFSKIEQHSDVLVDNIPIIKAKSLIPNESEQLGKYTDEEKAILKKILSQSQY